MTGKGRRRTTAKAPFRSAQDVICKIERWMTRGAQGVRSILAIAYKSAQGVNWAIQNEYEAFQEQLQAKHPDQKNPIDAWLEEWFSGINMDMHEVRSLIQAVRDGMTLREYQAKGAFGVSGVRQRAGKKPTGQRERPLPETPSEMMSPEERARQWEVRCAEMQRKYRELHREFMEMKAAYERLARHARRLARDLEAKPVKLEKAQPARRAANG